MNTLNEVKNRIKKEYNKVHQNPFVNTNGKGALLEVSVNISIKEIKELSKSTNLNDDQKQEIKQKIKAYYKGVKMFGKKRVLPVINQYGNIIIWID